MSLCLFSFKFLVSLLGTLLLSIRLVYSHLSPESMGPRALATAAHLRLKLRLCKNCKPYSHVALLTMRGNALFRILRIIWAVLLSIVFAFNWDAPVNPTPRAM
ncbi:hypothetical protein EV424DRAFT_1425234 [Suillus variegatus]|nr:hypothetical protein EV424DRAFT_1425234 [Suillus variegatus]